ncbi:hypothetical protein BGW80DRAFT_1460058 [Lactifluus volemus]|nr:hypothetical protein BGW80DRAFT_1460058 [Lactifluus volemus]
MISLKRAINWAHNHQQNNILPLGVQPASQSRSPLDMATTVAGVPKPEVPLPDISIFATSGPPVSQRLSTLRHENTLFFQHLKYVFLIPLSWSLTMGRFVRIITWRLWTLPLRLSIYFYEKTIRGRLPWLPSIWGTLVTLFPEGIKLPSLTSLTAGPYHGAGPMGQFATLNVDIGSIISGADEVANLETALNNVATSSKDKLGQELENVKIAKTEAETALNL